MSRKQTVSQLFAKFASEEIEIRARVTELKSELRTLTDRLSEVEVIRGALASVSPAAKKAVAKKAPAKRTVAKKAVAKKAVAKKRVAKKAVAKKAPAKRTVAKKTVAKKTVAKRTVAKKAVAKKRVAKKASRSVRKGRRKTSSGVHSMGIVDAAISLAIKNGVTDADAGDVLNWFRAAGYKTRTGTPTRNSVYVSLNREASTPREKLRITRPKKGRFAFHS